MLSELKIAQAHVNLSGIDGAGNAEADVFNDWPLRRAEDLKILDDNLKSVDFYKQFVSFFLFLYWYK